MRKKELIIVLFFVLMGVVFRLLPHPPNFTPILAIALFSGVYLSKKVALILPIAIMMASDVFIGSYEIKLMIVVYASFLLSVVIGFWLKKHKKWQIILGTSVFSAIIFFLLTNFAVWLFTPWYAKSFSGIIQCYLMALPFFRNTLLGTLFYTGALFGVYEIASVRINSLILNIKHESRNKA